MPEFLAEPRPLLFMKKMPKSPKSRDGGVYIVLFAILMFVLIAFLAVVLGLGLVSTNATRVQQLANTAAITALHYYVTEEAYFGDPLREQRARDRVNSVLGQNTIPMASEALGDVQLDDPGDPNSGGELVFGGYYSEDPDGTAGPLNPCSGSYPCFKKRAELPPELSVNAARVELRNRALNPILAPFASFLGGEEYRVSGSATSTLIQRCTAYLPDISLSMSFDSHWVLVPDPTAQSYHYQDASNPCGGIYSSPLPYYDLCPTMALFAYPQEPSHVLTIEGSFYRQPTGPYDTYCQQSGGIYATREGHIWCNTFFRRGSQHDRPACGTPPCPEVDHYEQDYRDFPTPLGWTRIDSFRDPQPLGGFFLAFNAGLRLVKQASTPGDSALVIPFTGKIRNRYPPTGVTQDIDLLLQLTNIRNRGMYGTFENVPGGTQGVLSTAPEDIEKHPNWIDMGWFPVFRSTDPLDLESNQLIALESAIESLLSQCPATAKRSIVMASDAVPTCYKDSSGVYQCVRDGVTGRSDWVNYVNAEPQFLEDDPSFNSILFRLNKERISFTGILAGQGIEPHFKNVKDASGKYINPDTAGILGMGQSYFDLTSSDGGATIADDVAYERFGDPGVVFRRPNWIMAALSFASGGLFCPLLPLCIDADCNAQCGDTNGCYEDTEPSNPDNPKTLRDCARVEGQKQTCAVVELSQGAQAADCVAQTVAGNPFILVE